MQTDKIEKFGDLLRKKEDFDVIRADEYFLIQKEELRFSVPPKALISQLGKDALYTMYIAAAKKANMNQ